MLGSKDAEFAELNKDKKVNMRSTRTKTPNNAQSALNPREQRSSRARSSSAACFSTISATRTRRLKHMAVFESCLDLEHCRAMHITSSWVPMVPHRSVPPSIVERFSRMFFANMFLKISAADGG
ncbi:hypothetical protein B0T26DRAFT_867696 [Lasiosphaeria miniovina]|uniref:Uncharacterized protein n=1 Tax=Lasiosphaeria miniovina TaxID=1954250 RepID=A0AA40BI62_9PEZI|nr:uncharacterized protein B0T26DRAFT_867696 [Lasiosphaeria miniovina]KAK0734698.1 hypothetical protein B0T26DRAFT_867696 [Lasiosphaeria miniovina]